MSDPNGSCFYIVPATTAAHVAAARSLVVEYADALGIDLSFQQFACELSNFPGDYGPPRGRLFLALHDQTPIGCVALRPLSPTIGEIKRLYVRPAGRGQGVGRALTLQIIDAARELGYARLRLDTLPTMRSGIALYKELGFYPIPAYRENPIEGAQFLEYLVRG